MKMYHIFPFGKIIVCHSVRSEPPIIPPFERKGGNIRLLAAAL